MSRRDKKFRQTYPGPDTADNQQMLQDIKQTLENHQKDEQPSSTAVDQMNKRSSPPTDVPTSSSPSILNRAPASRLTPTKQLAAHETKQKLAKIRQSIKPYGPRASSSDPGFNAAKDKVNKKMLDDLVALGHNEVRWGYGLGSKAERGEGGGELVEAVQTPALSKGSRSHICGFLPYR